jgi:RES domain-containing protein
MSIFLIAPKAGVIGDWRIFHRPHLRRPAPKAARIPDTAEVHIVKRDDAPNPNWLRPGAPSAGQQAFGDDLLRRHRFVAIPSILSTHSWNLIFDPLKAAGFHSLDLQEPFALDTRLHPPS